MRLKESLKRYLGDCGIPDIPDKAIRRPRHWSVDRWVHTHRHVLISMSSGDLH
jgi:hypothetical protein